MFILADRGTDETCVNPAKAAVESTIRLLHDDRKEDSPTVYIDSFRAYEPLNEDDTFNRECVVHGKDEYADEEVHVTACEGYPSRGTRGSRRI